MVTVMNQQAIAPSSLHGDGMEGQGAGSSEWPWRIAIAALVIAAFAGVLSAGFVSWDDPRNIYENPHLGLGAKQVHWMFTDSSYVRRYMPLGWFSYSVDRVLFGGSPASYHAGNLLLHIANALLLFAILQRLMSLSTAPQGSADKRRLAACAALATLFWALNPLRVEPVAWASARIYCVAGFFALLSIWAYLRATTGNSSPRRGPFWLSVGAYGVSVFTYPITLAVPVVLLAIDIFGSRRLPHDPLSWWSPTARRVLLEKAWFLVPAALMLAATLNAKLSNGQLEPIVGLDQFSVSQRLMQGFYIIGYYFWKPWLPDSLAPKYPALLDVNPVSICFVGSAALVAGITVLVWLRRRTSPLLAGAWMAHVALLFPVLGLMEHPHHAFDRYSYFQGTIWAVVVGSVLWKWSGVPRTRSALLIAVGGMGIIFGGMTFAQVKVWNNSLSLQTRMVKSLEGHAEAALHETVRGVLFMKRGEPAAAEAAFRHAIQLNAALAEPWRNLGDVLTDQHRMEPALECYREAIRLNPSDVGSRLNLSIALGNSGKLEDAAAELQRALTLHPGHAGAHHNLAVTLKLLGRTNEAREHHDQAERLRIQ
ncbi:MAG: protein O-mannosyl-transferase [Verrucomicrobiota bacterium]|jgi:tetratricopeptide (TPR) repeat protein